ncbi:hypothetical protein SSCG_04045 [Streptomyces clavuligerus]|nr:hypothetical protein SSCG_04045 [Streptomyces clavuligerus]
MRSRPREPGVPATAARLRSSRDVTLDHRVSSTALRCHQMSSDLIGPHQVPSGAIGYHQLSE